MIRYINNRKVEIDIHNMRHDEARRYLELFLSKANGSIREVVVIHGYTSGTVLQQMVRRELRHRRIREKSAGFNPGVTTLFLIDGKI
ncbi:MAG: Smr/MutS family protein [Clostridia bacterium]|nr:Smr/MutS family protein [Clostridia bacterium]